MCDGLLMAKDTQEPIGKGDVFFALREREIHSDKPNWHTFGELCYNSDKVVIENNTPMKFEEYGNVKGKLLYLEVYKAPFYDANGKTIGTVGAGRDITSLKKIQLDLEKSLKILDEQKDLLEYQANHDSLTDLPNRVLFMDRLQQSINSAQRYDKKVAILFMDLDHFKEINDSLGHGVGDKVLVEVSRRMKNKMRKSDTLSRFGGDEFCIILNDITHIEDISDIITSGMSTVKKPMEIEGQTLYLGMSIGVSVYPDDGSNPSTLLKNADAAMYKAKSDGRNTYCFYNETMKKQEFTQAFDKIVKSCAETKKSDLFFSDVIPNDEMDKDLEFDDHLPIYTVEAVATSFREQATPEVLGWKPMKEGKKFDKAYFIAKVVGRSMEPKIADGSWCLFRFERGGSRHGIVLVESKKLSDPETQQSFTIKTYHSEKKHFKDGTWEHTKITLSPANKEFKDIVLKKVSEEEFKVIAVFIRVIE